MMRYQRFTFLVNSDERRVISKLAQWLHRTQSDAVRFILLDVARKNQIGINNAHTDAEDQEGNQNASGQ